MASIVKPCTCAHKAQDKLHGSGNRVHNSITKKGKEGMVRCTVCGKETH